MKWSRNASRTTASKNVSGSCVITSVFVRLGVGGPELLVRDGGDGEARPGGVNDIMRGGRDSEGRMRVDCRWSR